MYDLESQAYVISNYCGYFVNKFSPLLSTEEKKEETLKLVSFLSSVVTKHHEINVCIQQLSSVDLEIAYYSAVQTAASGNFVELLRNIVSNVLFRMCKNEVEYYSTRSFPDKAGDVSFLRTYCHTHVPDFLLVPEEAPEVFVDLRVASLSNLRVVREKIDKVYAGFIDTPDLIRQMFIAGINGGLGVQSFLDLVQPQSVRLRLFGVMLGFQTYSNRVMLCSRLSDLFREGALTVADDTISIDTFLSELWKC